MLESQKKAIYKYRKTHPEKIKELNKKYRFKQRRGMKKISHEEINLMREKLGWKKL